MAALVALAAEPAAPDTSNGPVVVVLLGAFTLVGSAIAALAPIMLERVKGKNARAVPAPANAPAEPSSNQTVGSPGLAMFEQMVLDYRSQRDNALRDLRDARAVIRDQAAYIEQLEAQQQYGGGRGRAAPHDYRAWEPR